MGKKHVCSCEKLAVWVYMPGYSNGMSPFYCDECVPRGCACNHRYVDPIAYHPPLDAPDLPNELEDKPFKWLEENKIWTYLDSKGREEPCVDYDFDENGFDIIVI